MIIEMRTYTVQPGSVATVEERFGQALPARARLSPLAAFWHTEVGPLNRVIHVWAYDSLEERTRIRTESQKLEGWPPNIREFVTEQESKISCRHRSRRSSSRASSATFTRSAPTR
jgi:NIPSNAP